MGQKQHFKSMDGLRGLAAFAVMISHIEMMWIRNVEGATSFLPGQLAVDIFFVLSGFVMSYSYIRADIDWRRFSIARFARIYPLHIATALAMLAMELASTFVGGQLSGKYTPWEAVEEVLLLSALPGFSESVWNVPSWSISIEWWMYFTVFPLLVLLTKRTARWATAALVLMAYLALGLFLNDGFVAAGTTRGWIAVGRGVLGFASGWMVWRFWAETKISPSGWITDGAALVLAFAWYASIHFGLGAGWYALPIVPLFILGLSRQKGGVNKLLSARPLIWLGDISYSIYLIHMLVMFPMTIILKKAGLVENLAVWFVIVVPVTITIAAASYYWFEKPVRDTIRRLERPKVNVARSAAQ